ncbi:PREDICTED: aspartyl protease AED3-like [Tarenaya hassleriana]|uniref:aspartyl protease AED3-like n=1 Tax=Tarenaya hassleriana TaxID=28532 RepID=UPI00053C5AD4|nr:PREDICTED: aspartyl protease AED3-like [Tarenaya hassleriana]
MKTMRRTHLLLLIIPLLISTSRTLNCHDDDYEHQSHSSNLKIFHVFSPCSPYRPSRPPLSWENALLRIQDEDKARLLYLSSLAVAGKSVVPIASGRQIIQTPTYIVRANVGPPPQPMLVALDIGNDVSWLPCAGCVGCSSSVTFDSSMSTSFRSVDCQAPQCRQAPNPSCNGGGACEFNMTYGGSAINANLSQDTVTLSKDPIPNYTFGCIGKAPGTSLPPQGLLGFGRGPLSLMSQTQDLYKATFSYCLPNFRSENFSGSLRLGPVGQPVRIKTTPLLKNPKRSSLYYVNLVGIRVGSKVLDIPASAFAFDPVTGAGTVFDSGTVFTRLVEPAYVAVRNEFRRRNKNSNVTSLGGFDTCYSGPIVAPTITFMFAGMNVTLPQDNFLIRSTAGSTTCLAMAAAPNNVNSVLNVIASMQQQNHRVLVDGSNNRLGVARELCT